jgi:hypothetical protein
MSGEPEKMKKRRTLTRPADRDRHPATRFVDTYYKKDAGFWPASFP